MVETDSNVQARARKQLEFYFGDANMSHDRFMRQTMEADPDGYISIEVLCTFNKLKEITTDINILLKAAQESTELAVDESNKRIRRAKPLPKVFNVDNCTVFAELYQPDATLETLQEIFSTCGKVNYISIPKHPDGKPKGFSFVEYSNEKDAHTAVSTLNTIGNPNHSEIAPKGMRVISKDTWYRLRDEFKELQTRLRQIASASNAAPEAGLILFFGNVGPNVVGKDIKLALKEFAPVAYIDFDEAKRTGYARFKYPRGAQNTADKIKSTKFEIGGNQITCRILTGAEENEYWSKIHQLAAKKKQDNQSNKNNKNNNNFNNNNNNDNNDNGNGDSTASRKHPRTDETEDKDTKGKKQKGKEIKHKGRKIPSIAKAKPKTHVFFDNEDEKEETKQEEITTTTSENNFKMESDSASQETTTKKRQAEGDEHDDSKRPKVEEDTK